MTRPNYLLWITVLYSLSTIFFFFGTSAVQFHSILFESKGLFGIKFGLLLMAGASSGIVSPLIMSVAIKAFKKNTHALLLLMILSGLTLPLMPKLHSFYGLFAVFFIHTFCVWSLFPLHMSCGLEVCRNRGDHFFFVLRALGTFGFMLGCVFAFFWVDAKGVHWLYPVFGVSYLGAIGSLGLLIFFSKDEDLFGITPTSGVFSLDSIGSLGAFLKNTTLLKLLGVIAVLCVGNSMALGVQGNYILHHFLGDKSRVSLAWVICTSLEIPIMFYCLYLLKNYGIHRVLQISIAATCLRLVFLSVPNSPLAFGTGLMLHGFYWAGIATGAGICIDRLFKEHKTLFQIFASLIYMGLPSSTGNLMTGVLWKSFSLETVYMVSALLGVISFILFIPLFSKLQDLTPVAPTGETGV